MRTSPRWRPRSTVPPAPAEAVVASEGDSAQQRLTERARRSLGGRLAPPFVLVLGCFFVAVSLYRLDAIYAKDPGVLRSSQLAPQPIGVAHSILMPVFDDARNIFAKSHFGRSACERVPIDSLCEQRPPARTDDAKTKTLKRYGRALAPRADDVTVTGWAEHPRRIVVVSVARYGSEAAALRALRAARRRAVASAANRGTGSAVASDAWLEGKRVLVGMLASAPTRAAATEQLNATRRDVVAYVDTSRFFAFELLALGPLLLLFAAIFTSRALAVLAFGAAFAAFALAALALMLVALVVFIPVMIIRGRRKRRRVPDPGLGLGPIAPTGVSVESVDGRISTVAAENRSVMLALAGLVGFGIALLTRSLFPASLVWGSLLLVAIYAPTAVRSRRGATWMVRGRTLIRMLAALALAGVVLGLTPIGLLSDVRFQIVVVAGAMVILVEQWRDLVTETSIGYAKWYEDIDLRSSVFLAGVGLLTIGAASLFLGSNGDADLSAQAGEKLLALAGLVVASSTAAYARAARDAAARERARRRATPHVLYLRSFGDDKLRVVSPRLERRGLERLSWRRTELFEDVIARALSAIGPVVAIARPGTGQRDLGAARDSIVVDDWLAAVRSYMNEAVLVAVVMAASDGLVRELETLGELGLLDRVCVFAPPLESDDIDERLSVLARQESFTDLWGDATKIEEGRRSRIVALTTLHGNRVVLTASKRSASAYKAAGAYLAT
jgi:hypothetical protein